MMFLNPIAGLIGAAIAVPALVALYLLKLRRRTLRVSSTLLWEQAVEDLQANVPLRWLRWSWLLVVQLLALACALAALARPTIPAPYQLNARTVILIDRSASMSAVGPGPASPGSTRLDRARQRALEIIADVGRAGAGPAGNAPQAMLIAFAADARILQGFTSSGALLRDALSLVDASDQPDDLVRALEAVRALDSGRTVESDSRPALSVVLITDRAPRPAEIAGKLGANTRLHTVLVDEPAAPFDNLGIVGLSAVRDANTPSIARVFVRVANAGLAEVQTVLSCRVGDRPAGLRPITVGAATPVTDSAPSEAGVVSATFDIDDPVGGLVSISIPRADALASDNLAMTMVGPATRPRVLVVGPGEEPDDPFRAARAEMGIDRFLLAVLREMDLASLRTIDRGAYESARRAGAIEPASYDLVVFDRVEPTSTPDVPTLSIGAGLPALGVRVVAEPLPATRFAVWSRGHPIFRAASPDSVLISPPMRLTIPSADTGASPAPEHTFTELAQGLSGPLVLAIDDQSLGQPRRLVLAFDLLRTNWGADVSFPVIMASAVEHLTGRGDAAAGTAYTTTQSVSVLARAEARSIRVEGPRTFDVSLADSDADRMRGPISLGILDRAGLYTVTGAIPSQSVLPVNLLSDQETAPPIAKMQSGAAPRPESVPTTPDDSGSVWRPVPTGSREVWHWFALAAGVLSCLEWIVYAVRSRA